MGRRLLSWTLTACSLALSRGFSASIRGTLPTFFGTRAGCISRRITGTTHMSETSTDAATASSTVPDPVVTLGLPTPLLLGSASFSRKLVLQEMGVHFHVCARPIDEKSLGDRTRDAPHDLVRNLASAKMQHLVREIRAGNCTDDLPAPLGRTEWIVLTGDQVVTCDGVILEKPESVQEARDFVRRYASNPPSTVGSCVLTHLPSGTQVSGIDTATVHFDPRLPDDLVDRLLAADAPILSCAGGLMVEHPFVKEHIVRIDGTEDSVMGLSKDLVLRLLDELREKLGKTA
jgi:septum formation protein